MERGVVFDCKADGVLESAFRVPHDRPPKGLLMLTAYFDESGQEQKDWMFVAGYVGNDEAWKNFIGPWQDAITPRKHLHMNRLRFKRESERLMLERVSSVLKGSGILPFMVGIKQSDYCDLLTGSAMERALSGYILCCVFLVFRALQKLPPEEHLEVVFEEQQVYGHLHHIGLSVITRYAKELKFISSDGKCRLSNWRSVPKDQTSLTEPADCLAYSFLQLSRDSTSTRARWCSPILDSMEDRGSGFLLQPAMVREFVGTEVFTALIREARHDLRGQNGKE